MKELDFNTRYHLKKYKKFYFVIWVKKFKNIFHVSNEEAIIKFFNLSKNKSNFKKMIIKYNEYICDYKLDVDIIFEKIKQNYNFRDIKRKIKNFSFEKIRKEYNIIQKQKFFEKHGVNTILQKPEIKEKIKQTILEKYGVDNVSKNEKILDKIKQTKKEHFGDENYNNREKAKQTTFEKFGVENFSKLECFKEIFNDFDWLERNEKIKKTSLEKYGTLNPTQKHISNFENLNEKFVRENFIKNNKFLKDDFCNYFNLSISSVRNFKKSFKIKEINKHNLNKLENTFVNLLNINLNKKLNQQYRIKNYVVDAFDLETKTVYEFLGDFWHGNLEIYKPEDVNKRNKQTMLELNLKTFEKLKKIKEIRI